MPRALWLTNIPSPYANHRYGLLAEHLGALGIDFDVIFLAWSESDRHWRFAPDDLPFPHRRVPGIQPAIGTRRMHVNPGVVAALRHPHPALAVVAGYSAPSLAVAPFVLPRSTVRLLWSETQAASEESPNATVRAVKRRLHERYDGFVVPGDTQRDYIHALAPATVGRPVIRLPHIVDESRYHDRVRELRGDADSVRARFGVGADEQLWVTAARLEPRKGVDALLPLLQGVDGVRLVVAGTGSQLPLLEELTTTRRLPVTFAGHVDLDTMLGLYAAADLFALPSRRDPSPVSAVEAAAAGLPLLLSGLAGNVDDLVEDGVTGWRFAPDDPEAMADLVRAIAARSRAELATMGEAATARYRERFDSVRRAREAAEAMADLVERGR